jgi:hypothetical protein
MWARGTSCIERCVICVVIGPAETADLTFDRVVGTLCPLNQPHLRAAGVTRHDGGMSTRSTAADRWRKIIQQQQASGSSVAAFCRRAGLSQPSFYAWRRKFRGEVTFAEVKVLPTTPSKSGGIAGVETSGIELRLPGHRSVMVRPGFDRQTLLELLNVLETGPFDRATREMIA